MANQISPRQQKVYEFIRHYVGRKNESPTIGEICEHFNLSSPATIHYHLGALEKAGLINRIPNVSRGISLPGETNQANRPNRESREDGELPLLGVVAAGVPIEAVLSNETVPVPKNMVTPGRSYALKVRGDSMIDEHIRDGDILVVSARNTAENGQTVIALIDGREATVKKFYQEKKAVRLEPANLQYKPIYIRPPQKIDIQGVVVGCLRYC
jgi:repressor LexA